MIVTLFVCQADVLIQGDVPSNSNTIDLSADVRRT